VLIALFDAGHVHHNVAHDWFADNRSRGWATSPPTESALLRIASNPRYGENRERAPQLAARLRSFCGSADHLFWPSSVSLRDEALFDLAFATHRQLTDVYLAGLAHKNGGHLATFDRSIPLKTIVGASPDLLEVIGA
jgi:predicted nucleic acid-binding protein